jgi:hypothetical protein
MTMTTPIFSNPGQRARWQTLWHKLHATRFDPLPSNADVERVLASLPKRLPSESLPDWLRRAAAGPARKLTPLAEFERWAAGSAADAYPLPETPMISLDEAFRLSAELFGGIIKLRVEALGPAAFDYAGRAIGLALQDGSAALVEFQLDEEGNGEASVADEEPARLALIRPRLVLIEPTDGG